MTNAVAALLAGGPAGPVATIFAVPDLLARPTSAPGTVPADLRPALSEPAP